MSDAGRNRKRVVVIEGDDAAPEAMRPTVALLRDLCPDIEWIVPENPQDKARLAIADHVRAAVEDSDATFFGSTSGNYNGCLFYLRWGKQTFANVRPTRWLPGYDSPLARPEGVDFVIVRENLEDAYVRIEGDVRDLAALNVTSPTAGRPPQDLAPGRYSLKVISEAGSERVIRYAFELARKRKAEGHPGKLTLSSKFNMLPQTDGLFLEVGQRVAPDYPDIAFEVFIIDNFARHMVVAPDTLDVVVLPNLYGDVFSDMAAGLVGSLGVAASGVYGDDYAYFESAHGTAPDIAGQNIINPTACIFSGAMMLDYLGFAAESTRLVSAVEAVYGDGATLTPDMGGKATTTAFCDAVAAKL